MTDLAVSASAPDLAALASAFGNLLHAEGVPVTPEQSGRFARAINLARPLALDDLYWVGRVTLLTGHAQTATFDRAFAQVFGGIVDLADHRGDTSSSPVATPRPQQPSDPSPKVPPPSAGGATGAEPKPRYGPGDAGSADDQREMTAALASAAERLATADFADLEPSELDELALLMRALRMTPPTRPGRRARRHRTGDRLDLRATLRASRHKGGDPAALMRKRRRHRPRKVVVLCDISGSMAPYARAYLQFLHAAAAGSRAEVFTFSTRLTRLTRELGGTRAQASIDQAVAAASDWRGGTRIGHAIASFLDGYGRRGMARGAVVVIVSDGWEADDPALLAEQMARLARLAHRIVWVNPRTADSRYEPLAGGMRVALPHCDALVSGHSFAAMAEVVTAVAAIAQPARP